MKKFTKKILIDQCGFTESEAYLIMDYQKKIPLLSETNDVEGFIIDARSLYRQLNPDDSDGHHFTTWWNRRVKSYRFEENLDFSAISPFWEERNPSDIAKGGDLRSKDYLITIDMAKQLAMVEKSEVGSLSRKYFILMEKCVKRYTKWNLVRQPLRQGYRQMDKALNAYLCKTVQRNADDWDYKYEANALNIMATGFTAQEIRLYVGATDNITRDHLTEVYNSYLLKMQELDTMYLNMGMNKLQRYQMLKDSFDALFPNPVLLKGDSSRRKVEENKNKLLQEVKEKSNM